MKRHGKSFRLSKTPCNNEAELELIFGVTPYRNILIRVFSKVLKNVEQRKNTDYDLDIDKFKGKPGNMRATIQVG